MERVMRCKLKLHHIGNSPRDGDKYAAVRFGAVWEGSTEKQMSENAVFGAATPVAEFNAIIHNQDVIAKLEVGKEYYLDFVEVGN